MIMKKLALLICSLAAWNANAERCLFDGVVIVGGAVSDYSSVVYDTPVIYDAPVWYGGTVIYNGPVIYNVGQSAVRSCLNACTGWYYPDPGVGYSCGWNTTRHGHYRYFNRTPVIRFGSIEAARYGYHFQHPR
jgi:hypothetical protein